MKTKICNKCNIEQEINCFRIKKTNNKYYICGVCKNCEKAYRIEYNIKNKEKIKETKKRYKINNKDKINEQARKHYKNHRKEMLEKHKIYYDKNKKRLSDYNKKYRLNHLEEINKREKTYRETRNLRQKERLKNDNIFKFKRQIRDVIRQSFKRKKFVKKESTEKIIGCNYDFFIEYLLNTFKNNYGYEYDNKEIVHIDHIIPLSTAKTKEEIIKLNNYTNLQLLKAKDNLEKSNKLDWTLNININEEK